MGSKKEINKTLFIASCLLSFVFHAGIFYILYLNPPLVRVVSTKLFPPNYDRPFVGALEDKELEEYQQKNEALDEALAETYFIRKSTPYSEESEGSLAARLQSSETQVENFLKGFSEGDREESLMTTAIPSQFTDWESHKEEDSLAEVNSELEGITTIVSLLAKGRPFIPDIGISEESLIFESETGDVEALSRQFISDEALNESELFSPSHELGVGTDFNFSMRRLRQAFSTESVKTQADYDIKHKKPLKSESLFQEKETDFEEYGLPDILVKKWGEQFESHLSTFTDEEGEIYFSIELKPSLTFKQASLSSTYFFVIDMTHSNAKKDYPSHVQAVTKTLKHLEKGDRFNIALLSKTKVQLFDHFSPFNMKTLLEAEDFLKKGSDFSGRMRDFLDSFSKTLESLNEEKEEMGNIFLLTSSLDKALSKEEKQTLQKIIKSARGKAAIFPVFAKAFESHPLHEALSLTTGGKILAYPTVASYARKLSGLVLDVKTALLKNLFIDVIPDDKDAIITLAPYSENFVRLYERRPLKIVGKINKPSAFTLRIRGMNGEELVTIEKKIALHFARKGSSFLKKNFESAKRTGDFYDFALGHKDIPDKLEQKVRNRS